MKKIVLTILDYLLILVPVLLFKCSYYISRILVDIFHCLTGRQLINYDYTMYNILHVVVALIMAILMLYCFRKHSISSPKITSINDPVTFFHMLGKMLICFAIYEVIESFLLGSLYILFPASDSADKLLQSNNIEKFNTQWYTFLHVGIIAPVMEEIYFRKLTFCFAGRKFKSPYVIIAVSSFIFAVAHGYSIPGLIAVFVSGVFLGSLFYVTGSLWFSIIAHCLANLICLLQLTNGGLGYLCCIFIMKGSLLFFITK